MVESELRDVALATGVGQRGPRAFAAGAHPAHRNAVAVKGWVRASLGELLAGLGAVADPEVLADQLALVMEGVYGSVQALGVGGPAQRGRAFAEALLAQALPQA